MDTINTDALTEYLRGLWGERLDILQVRPIGKAAGDGETKGFGYGVPLRIDLRVDGQPRSVVLETMSANAFGHEHRADRAQSMVWSHGAYNSLPRHARSLDVGAVRTSGEVVSLGNADEFFVLMDFVDGENYAADLARISQSGELGEQDLARADALCDYLLQIHRVRGTTPSLYVRRIRELVGHGECIMGILDAYPLDEGMMTREFFEGIERQCIDWRWKLKSRVHRLREVHGDFHPWNILFRKKTDFSVLDRSRGEWGDPADDVACLTLNYAFFSLLERGRLEGPFQTLFTRFWQRYLAGSYDGEILEVVAPFFAFRSLVMACPVWYPTLANSIREKLLKFTRRILDTPRFDPTLMASYFETYFEC